MIGNNLTDYTVKELDTLYEAMVYVEFMISKGWGLTEVTSERLEAIALWKVKAYEAMREVKQRENIINN